MLQRSWQPWKAAVLACLISLSARGLASQAGDATSLSGNWALAATCRGVEQWWALSVAPQGDARLVLVPAPDGAPVRAVLPTSTMPWRVTWHERLRHMIIKPQDGRIPWHMELVRTDSDTEPWAGVIKGTNEGACSLVAGIGGTTSAQEAQRALLTALPAGWDQGPPRPSGGLVGAMGRLFSSQRKLPDDPCDAAVIDWVRPFTQGQRLTRTQPLDRIVAARYQDEVFEPAFGRPLGQLSVVEGQHLTSLLNRAINCPALSRDRSAMAMRSWPQLLQPLTNSAPFTRRHMALTIKGASVLAAWGEHMMTVLNEWDQTATQDLKADEVDAWLAAQASLAPWTMRGDAFHGMQLAQSLRSRAATVPVLLELEAGSGATASTLAELDQLAARLRDLQNRGAGDLLPRARQAVLPRIQSQFPAALQLALSEAQGTIGHEWLTRWPSPARHVLELLSEEQVMAAQAQVDARKNTLESEALAAAQRRYALDVEALPLGAKALAAGKVFEGTWRAGGAQMVPATARANFDQQRSQRRLRDWPAAEAEILRAVANAPHATALDEIKAQYLMPEDETRPEVQRMRTATTARLAELAPWQGAPAADYLNALYNGDEVQLEKIDKAFREPYKQKYLPAMLHGMPLVEGIMGMAGFKMDLRRYMTEAFDEISLIRPMITIYLIEYEGRMKRCLEPDAIRFQITTTSKTVYRNGFDTFMYEVRHPDQIEYFTVNRRFGHIFELVGTSRPDSLLTRMLDAGLHQKDALGLSELIAGTRAMMVALDKAGCDSPLKRRMEANMLKWANQHLSYWK